MISPDGQWVALAARAHDGKWGIAIRELTTGATSFLPQSQAFRGLCWSHDSKEILVQEGNRLLALDVASGTVREVTVVVGSLFGATWNADDVVLFGIDGKGIHRVSALGGSAEELIHPDPSRGETSVTYPYFLPDGNRFLYLARQYPDGVRVHTLRAGALDSTETTLVGEIASSFALLDSGYLLHVADGTLMATRFDPDGLELSGRPIPIAHGVSYFKPVGITLFSAARDGTLLYRKRATNKSLVWFDAAGVQQEVLIDRGEFKGFEISPDDDQAAIAIVDPRDGTSDIWLHGLNRGTASRFTVASGEEAFPVWMPDGKSIVFSWERRDAPDIFVKNVDGAGEETLLIGANPVEFPADVSPDGRHLLYFSNLNEPEWDVWTVEIGDPASARLLVGQPATRLGGQFSPDGRLVAYGSDETGRWQIWVRPFTSPGRAVQITTDGVTSGFARGCRWARRGRTLYYANGKSLYAVDLSTEDGLTKPQPHLLFETPHPIDGFDLTGDGRFLVELRDDSIVEPLHVIVNWSPPQHCTKATKSDWSEMGPCERSRFPGSNGAGDRTRRRTGME
jgi:hypothetical protein